MRERTNRDRVIAFMRHLGRVPGASGRIYLTGGASAVLEGWRDTTIDIDVDLEGDAEELLHAIPAIKDGALNIPGSATALDELSMRGSAVRFESAPISAICGLSLLPTAEEAVCG